MMGYSLTSAGSSSWHDGLFADIDGLQHGLVKSFNDPSESLDDVGESFIMA